MSVIYMPEDKRFSGLFGALAEGLQKRQQWADDSQMYKKLAGLYPDEQPQNNVTVPKGLFGAAAYQFNPSLTGQSQQQPVLSPELLKPQLTQADYDNQAAFEQSKAEHPEWFKGDTYVGDQGEQAGDSQIADQQVAQTQPQQQAEQKQYGFSNPLGTPDNKMKMPNLQSVRNQNMRGMYLAAAELAKSGHNPKDFVPLLKQSYDDKINDLYNQQVNDYVYNSLVPAFNNSTNPMHRAMVAAQMKKYGLDVDPKMISTLQPNIKATTMNLGGTIQVVGYDAKDPSKVYNLATGEVTLNPNTKYTADMNYQGKVDAANINASSRITAAGMRGGNGQPKQVKYQGVSGAVYTPQQLQQASDDYNEYVALKDSGELDLVSSSEQKRYNKAARMLNDYYGNSGDE